MAQRSSPVPNEDFVDCLISRLNFQRPDEVMPIFRSSTKAGKKKLILKLCSMDNRLLFNYLLSNQDLRQEYLLLREEAHPHGIMAGQAIYRKVVNNPYIETESTKYYGICAFNPAAITNFLISTLKSIMG